MSERRYPLVSVIVLNYNCRGFLGSCLSSLLNTEYPRYELILVDNGSTDGSLSFALQEFSSKGVQVKALSRNYGYAKGNNFGAKEAKGDYLIFLNPDTEVDPSWIRHLIREFEADFSIGIAQPRLLQGDRVHFDSAGCFINPYGLVTSRAYGEKDRGQYSSVTEISYAKGAALAIRRDLWKELGGFDPIFFTYYEETDLCWRARNVGYKVVYVPKAIVYHVGGGILKRVLYHTKFHEARGRLILLIKNYSSLNVLRYVPATVLLHFFNVIRQLTKGESIAAVAVTKGTIWCIPNFGSIWTARRRTQTITRRRVQEKHARDGKAATNVVERESVKHVSF